MSTRILCYNTECRNNYKAWCKAKKIEISKRANDMPPLCVTFLEKHMAEKESLKVITRKE